MSSGLLLSGGMDSTAIAYWKNPAVAYTIDYGQHPARGEIRASRAICSTLGIAHEVISVDCSTLGSGDLVGASPNSLAPASEWWPYRNQLLVTLAAMRSIKEEITVLMMGALRTDGFHKDGTQAFIEAMDNVLSMQEGRLRLSAPAIDLDAVELIRRSEVPGEILAWAHSCHVSEYACGFCRGCRKHYETMAALGHVSY